MTITTDVNEPQTARGRGCLSGDGRMRVLSLGAGVQSSTLALMIEHGEIPPVEYAVFADTEAEPESVYRWLDWLEKQLSYPVHRISRGSLEEGALRLRTSKGGVNYTKHAIPKRTDLPSTERVVSGSTLPTRMSISGCQTSLPMATASPSSTPGLKLSGSNG